MSRKILVAGLGHGGIATAAQLSKNGYEVTIFEASSEGTLGYDWTDCFAPESFGIAGFPMPDEKLFVYKEDMTFFGPGGDAPLKQHVPKNNLEIKMERKDLYSHIINHALECGVKIKYDCKVLAPIMLGNRVVGIKTECGDFYGDLVIDACGMYSPVRLNLPDSLGIQKDIPDYEKIRIFRAFYNKSSDFEVDAKFRVTIFGDNILGVSWVASEEEYTDVLIGRFEEYGMDEVNRFTELLRKDNPRLGDEIVRGGEFVQIPVRHPLSKMVADGYCAIGDAAFMTVPVLGSGIANSFKASKLLADTIMNDKNDSFSAETLWPYQYKYFKTLGTGLASLAAGKLLLLDVTPQEIDYAMRSGMVTDDDITIGADFTSIFKVKVRVGDLINKAVLVCKDTVLLKKMLACGARIGKALSACALMPKKYDSRKVAGWAEIYDRCFRP